MWVSIGYFNKIISILESKNVNYLLIDKSHNYEEIDKMNYKGKNKMMMYQLKLISILIN